MKIEGVPEGWELVAIRNPLTGEFYLNGKCDVRQAEHVYSICLPIVRKIEKPKRYRPFASGDEFRPFRERWWRYRNDLASVRRPPRTYKDDGCLNETWAQLFMNAEFEDGQPFGIEVTE